MSLRSNRQQTTMALWLQLTHTHEHTHARTHVCTHTHKTHTHMHARTYAHTHSAGVAIVQWCSYLTNVHMDFSRRNIAAVQLPHKCNNGEGNIAEGTLQRCSYLTNVHMDSSRRNIFSLQHIWISSSLLQMYIWISAEGTSYLCSLVSAWACRCGH